MLDKFRDSKASPQVLWLLLLTTLISLFVFGHRPVSLSYAQAGPLYIFLVSHTGSNMLTIGMVSWLLIMGTGYFLNEMMKIFRAIPVNSYIVLLFWLVLYSLQPALWQLSPPNFANLLLVVGFFTLFKSGVSPQVDKRASPDLINAALSFSLASLLYKPYGLMPLFLVAVLLLMRQLTLRSVLTILVSFALPYLYYESYRVLTGYHSPSPLPELSKPAYSIDLSFAHYFQWLPLILLLLLTPAMLLQLMINFKTRLIEIRMMISVFLLFLTGNIFILFFFSDTLWTHMPVIMLPLASLFGLSAYGIKNTLTFDVGLWIILIISLIIPLT